MSTKICPTCTKEFEVQATHQNYYSKECRKIAKRQRLRKPRKVYLKTCDICGKNFESFRPHQKHCSPECLKIAKNKNSSEWFHKNYSPKVTVTKRLCAICGRYFESNTYRKTCSEECDKIHQQLRKCENARRRRRKNPRPMRAIQRRSYAKNIEKNRLRKKKYYYEHYDQLKNSRAERNIRDRIQKKLEQGRSFCQICGKYFTPEYEGQKYCSDKCRNDPKAKALRKFFTQFFADGYLNERDSTEEE